MTQCFERVERLERQLAEHVKTWRLSPVVEALQALRGVRFTVAVTTIAELGDLTRFAKPRQLMAFRRRPTESSTVVTNPRISAISTVVSTGPASSRSLTHKGVV